MLLLSQAGTVLTGLLHFTCPNSVYLQVTQRVRAPACSHVARVASQPLHQGRLPLSCCSAHGTGRRVILDLTYSASP